jgi:hypothetical protein
LPTRVLAQSLSHGMQLMQQSLRSSPGALTNKATNVILPCEDTSTVLSKPTWLKH